MASPLELFRKKQKVLMVPLTILAMFAFVVMDQLNPEQIPPILGMLVFGPLFWYLGKDRGKGKEFAIAGIVLGFALGYMYIPRVGTAMVISSTAGNLDQQEYQEMVNNRNIANQFIVQTYYASLSEEELQRARPPQGAVFGFPFAGTREDDIILEFLFRKEADKMNLIVSDDAISNYISRYTNNKLSRADFQKACQNVRMTEGQIYNVFRDQLKARLAFQLLRPEISLTPDQYWNFYKKLNVREELEVAALPVKDFESEVPEPTEAEKKTFYETYKAVSPNQKGPGTPGLFQPPKVKVEYLLVDYVDTEKQVAAVTDEQIKAYYEENKESLYKNNPIPDDPSMNAPEAPAGPQGDAPVEAKKPTSGEKAPAEPAAPEKKPADKPAPKADDKPQPKPEKKPEPAKKPEPEKKPESKEESSALDSELTTFVALQDEKKTADKPATAPKPEAKPADAKPEAAPAEAKPENATTAPPPLEPYRPLNEDLKSEIRDQILRTRTLELMQEKIGAATTFMNELSYRITSPAEGETPLTPKEATAQLKKYAAEHQLVYNVTPLMSRQEILESEKYPLGTAKEPTLNEFAAQPQTATDQLFAPPVDQLYTPFEAEDSFSSALISYWKIEYAEAMIPPYDNPEIQETIVEQIKLEQARPLAQKRAEELQKLITDAGDKEMATALKGQTITGEKEGTELLTQTTESFSWMRTSTAGASNPFSMPRPELSTISAIDGAGNDFMEQVFDKMQEGDVSVAMNADKSVVYVVKVLNRIPSTPGGMTAMYQEFLKTDLFFFFSPYLPLAQMEQYQAMQEWVQDLRAQYQVQQYFDQLAPPEEPEQEPLPQ